MPDTLGNPRPGLRRWVCSSLELPMGREIVIELHHDGTVVIAANVSWLRGREEPPAETDDLPVPERLVETCCYDLVTTVQELQRKLRLDSTLQITAALTTPSGPRAMAPLTSAFHDVTGLDSTPSFARRPHHLQPVHALLSPAAGDDEARTTAEELHADLMNQFGV
ncbi:hypothetical protein [Streptomyces rimosus]|uniref:hypothetical protein n=1 Tax=Streptomyces rimosus TaxID=1927 RepID=UPI0004C5ACE9|nr:hypothetical protein [Streptomyces rimosus]